MAPRTDDLGRSGWLIGGILAVYVATIVYTSMHHEAWRDEVVAASIAWQSPSWGELWRFMRHEGHPILWYVCLRLAHSVVPSTAVLPVLSLLISTAAAFVLLRWAPFPLWLRCLFLFGYVPLYEYTVVWRGYGLSMLLVFTFCALYPERRRRPILVGVTLALLANSTVFGLVMAVAAGAMLVVDRLTNDEPIAKSGPFYVGMAVWAAGIVHTLVNISPGSGMPQFELNYHDAPSIVRGILRSILFPAGHASGFFWIPWPSLWLWLSFLLLLLLRRLPALAFFALSAIGFEVVFTLAYAPTGRHLGNMIVLVIAAVWLAFPWELDEGRSSRFVSRDVLRWWRYALTVPLVVALGFHVWLGAASVLDDIRLEYSSSKRLAAIIAADPSLDRAIVIGEPETLMQSLAYYRENPVYLPQEGTFRNWVVVTEPRRHDCDLGALLATAKDLRARLQVPVILALGWLLDGADRQSMYVGTFFEQRFTMSAVTRDEFLRQTELLGRLRDAPLTDENYDVFVLR